MHDATCQRIEGLLPAYAEGDVSATERALVESHVADCETCRESLALFHELEHTLLERREMRPSATIAAGRLMARVAPRRSWRVLHALAGAPGLVSAAFATAGILTFLFRESLASFLARVMGGFESGFGAADESTFRALAAIERLSTSAGEQLPALLPSNEMALLSIYLGILALILGAGSWMVLRFVRES